jgi:cell division protein YceG involved in septum cleavage
LRAILYGACGYDKEGLISSTAVFKVYATLSARQTACRRAPIILSKNMSVKQIVEELCEGNPPKATVKFTIPEGYTITSIANVLMEKD